MASKTWNYSLSTVIVEILEKKKTVTDSELYDLLRETNKDIGVRSMYKTLMEMEIKGKIYVSTLTRGKRQIELKNSETK